jgi:transposase InsO family protein
VWCADITYIPMKHGFMYLMAVMDWWSRFVLAWELSNTLEAGFIYLRGYEHGLELRPGVGQVVR